MTVNMKISSSAVISQPNLSDHETSEKSTGDQVCHVSNELFLKTIFGEQYGYAYVTCFPDDPSNISTANRLRCWSGGYYKDTVMQDNTNQYFAVSLFKADDQGKARRRKALFIEVRIVMLDDVREKLPIEQVMRLPRPTFKMETSPGSEQWGYVLDVPCTNRSRFDNLQDGLVSKGLSPKGVDPGQKGCTRFCRLPEGSNTKAKRVAANGGVAPRCKMLEWNPDIKVSMEGLAQPFNIDLDAERREGRVDGAAKVDDHPLLDLADIIHIKEVRSDGRYDITCPWVEEHTGAVDDGAAVFTNNDGSIGFCCHHGSCGQRTGKDLLNLIEESHVGFKKQLNDWKVQRAFLSITDRQDQSLSIQSNNPSQLPQQPPTVGNVKDERKQSARWPDILHEDAFPALLGDFVTEATKNSEADPAAVLAQFLCWFSIAVGPKPHFMVGDSRHTARENAVIVGETSKGRKGTSAAPVAAVLKLINDPCSLSPGPLSSGEGIIYSVRDETKEWKVDKKSGAGEWIVTDPGVTDKRLLVVEEEFASALQASKREGNTLSSILRTLYDSGNADPLTKTSKIKCTGAHVGITAHITLFELKKLLSENDKLNGFGNRFMWICSKRSKLVAFPEPLSESFKLQMVDHLNTVISRARVGEHHIQNRAESKGRRYVFSPEARELWGNVYPDLTEARDGIAGAMVGRAEAHVMRLSLIYCLFRGGDQIEGEDLRAALAFWKYADQSANYIFSGKEVPDRNKQKILECIGEGAKTTTEIRREAFSGHIDGTLLNSLLADLVTNEVLAADQQKTAGAPKTVYQKRSCVLSVISDKSCVDEQPKTLMAHKKHSIAPPAPPHPPIQFLKSDRSVK